MLSVCSHFQKKKWLNIPMIPILDLFIKDLGGRKNNDIGDWTTGPRVRVFVCGFRDSVTGPYCATDFLFDLGQVSKSLHLRFPSMKRGTVVPPYLRQCI